MLTSVPGARGTINRGGHAISLWQAIFLNACMHAHHSTCCTVSSVVGLSVMVTNSSHNTDDIVHGAEWPVMCAVRLYRPVSYSIPIHYPLHSQPCGRMYACVVCVCVCYVCVCITRCITLKRHFHAIGNVTSHSIASYDCRCLMKCACNTAIASYEILPVVLILERNGSLTAYRVESKVLWLTTFSKLPVHL